ncbi:cob(I)yrinic acid a,c-diamide adenosyltransferase [Advenella alkanexedens]|uniref:Cobalamin adenosyltransferase n=1 Tax=Advenella alkanexedens TaxID=1481665 RepID=A0ABS6NSY5_9BURK|nr:cob(I)yrinic acid a,c-diamide adenosyltransferase [Advenella alkanexedens]MBV4398306.1 cob(I)yrinic acid a,c-diamide adenosyltransferase [Advenella alkanexedens]
MADRLTSIVTKTGDAGTTSLGDGSRIAKNDARIEAIGQVDELNSFIGLLACEPLPNGVPSALERIQHHLFDLGSELCVPGYSALIESHVTFLETEIERSLAELPPLKEFILPGGTRPASLAHVCRSICRRAERGLVTLDQREPLNDIGRQYLNRLSDYFFMLARILNKEAGRQDIFWQKEKTS